MTPYLNPASLLNLTSEIGDRLFNAYQTDLPRKVDFVDGTEHIIDTFDWPLDLRPLNPLCLLYFSFILATPLFCLHVIYIETLSLF